MTTTPQVPSLTCPVYLNLQSRDSNFMNEYFFLSSSLSLSLSLSCHYIANIPTHLNFISVLQHSQAHPPTYPPTHPPYHVHPASLPCTPPTFTFPGHTLAARDSGHPASHNTRHTYHCPRPPTTSRKHNRRPRCTFLAHFGTVAAVVSRVFMRWWEGRLILYLAGVTTRSQGKTTPPV